MALRCFLVGLVACFGLDAPTSNDAASWAESGRAWLSARASDLDALRVGATRWLVARDPASRPATGPAPTPTPAPIGDLAPAPGAEPDPADEAFGAIAEATVGEFLADRAALAAQDDPPAAEAEGDEWTPRGAPAEANRLVLARSTTGPADPVPTAGDGAGGPPRPARAERLSSAVRLTHEAMQAWAALAWGAGSGESRLR